MTARVWMLTPHANGKHQANAEQITRKESDGFMTYFSNELLSVFGKLTISLHPLESLSRYCTNATGACGGRLAPAASLQTCLKSNSATFMFSFRIAWLQTAGFSSSRWISFSLHLQYFWVLWEFQHGPVHGGSRRVWTAAGFPWTRL